MASFNQTAGTRTQARNNTQAIVVTAMCIALTYIFTAVVNIRLPFAPNGGLIHLGNVPLFLAAIIFGRKTGALSGAFGMGLFDLFSGWTAWAPFTFVIVGQIEITSFEKNNQSSLKEKEILYYKEDILRESM